MSEAATENSIKLKRDVQAILIPAGTPVLLPSETEVQITQSLGEHYTVYAFGNLARIDAKDADALGYEKSNSTSDLLEPEGELDETFIRECLQSIYDPEIPVNIVDLGLIYACHIDKTQTGYHVTVDMTLTAPGCGIGPLLVSEVDQKVRSIKGVNYANVNLVFDPPWDKDMMSDEAKLALNIF